MPFFSYLKESDGVQNIMRRPSQLSLGQRELIGAYVSAPSPEVLSINADVMVHDSYGPRAIMAYFLKRKLKRIFFGNSPS